MDAEIDLLLPYSTPWKVKNGRRQHASDETGFRCMSCHAYVHNLPWVSGVQNRNHCPYCLHSRHLDHAQPGDRLSACKGLMQPIGLTVKRTRNKYAYAHAGEPPATLAGGPHVVHTGEPLASQSGEPPAALAGGPLASQSGELMLIHRCSECGRISINRIAADDTIDGLFSLLCASSGLDEPTRHQLAMGGILLLQCSDMDLVERQLCGYRQK